MSVDDERAHFLSLAEGLERYSSYFFRSEQLIVASATELGHSALDLRAIPRCSENELRHPRCPLVAPDPGAPIRWVRGLSLIDGRDVHVPAVMVYLYAGITSPAERFWIPISTGCAAHVTYEQALVSAILEVVERDSISLLWLQQLNLPRIEIDHVPPVLEPRWDRFLRSSPSLQYTFLDATTDLGVPTVYCVQTTLAGRRVKTLVACSSHADPASAVGKVIGDLNSLRVAFRHERDIPSDIDAFKDVLDGATFMAHADRAQAFNFLLDSASSTRLSQMKALPEPAALTLPRLLDIFRRREMDVIAVDLSTDEAIRCGMRVVRVIIPALQPLSFRHRARFLGNPRVYDAPRRMGYAVHDEEHLNNWPQPFG